MALLPSWAPNAHPLVIHFPIVLVLLAALVDVVHLLRPRAGLSRLAAALWVLGGVSAAVAYFTGRAAAATVFTPGMAHALIDEHGRWGLVTTLVLAGVAVVRVNLQLLGRPEGRGLRVLYAVMGLAAATLVAQTADRGGRLVYEQGVGVIRGSGTSN